MRCGSATPTRASTAATAGPTTRRSYFNDCARFLDGAAWGLRPGATALVVIGNSILQGVPIPTDRFLAAIAETRGFAVAGIHVPRETRVGSSIVESSVRAGKAAGNTLYETVVELRRL